MDVNQGLGMTRKLLWNYSEPRSRCRNQEYAASISSACTTERRLNGLAHRADTIILSRSCRARVVCITASSDSRVSQEEEKE